MRQYLAEGLKGSITFFPDKVPKALVQEDLPDGHKGWRIPGRFSESDVVNGNGRRYRKSVWEKNLQEGSTLRKLIGENGAFGLLEHPKDGQVTLDSPISHSVTSVKLDENGVVSGEITIIDYGDNSPGRKLKALIEQGYNPRVSSRGFGSLVKGTDGVDEVQEDYVCEGWDVVIKPSFETAVLNPDRSSPALTALLGRHESLLQELHPTCKKCKQYVALCRCDSPDLVPSNPGEPADVKARRDREFRDRIKKQTSSGPPVSESSPLLVLLLQAEQAAQERYGRKLDQLTVAELESLGIHSDLSSSQPASSEASPTASASPAPTGGQFENLKLGETPTGNTASSASAGVSAVAQPQTQVITESIMNIQEVKSRIAQLRSQGQAGLSPKRFAEGVAVMAELHNAVAAYVAEDSKRSWEGTKLHQEIESLENTWASAQTAPAKTVTKLRENQTKVLHVCKNLVETALKYKGALVESLKASAAQQRLVEEITTNGRGWMSLANKRKARMEFLEKKYALATECLQVMTARYNEDMSTLGAHIINLEFREKLTPDLQTALKEAKTPKAILAIREKLEGKPEAAAPTTPTTPAAAKMQESKPAPSAAARVSESKPAASAASVSESEVPANPRNSVTESLGILSRLSLASAK